MFKDQKEQQEFEKWAFGSSSQYYATVTMHAWNSLHGDLLWLKEGDGIEDSLKKMYALWKEHDQAQIQ